MRDHPDYPWDHHSDQPRIMRNKALKKEIYRRAWLQFLKANLLTLFLPVILLIKLFRKKTVTNSNPGQCLGLSVHVETEAKGKSIVPLKEISDMVDELGVKHLLMRIPLADVDRLDIYLEHLDQLLQNDREVVINLLQERTLLEDPAALRVALELVFSALQERGIEYVQVGNAYNRRKWGFDHFGHYQNFFKEVRFVAQEIAPSVKLLGGSVIDFEIVHLLESLFHFRPNVYDGYASQLYVDRRGAPENTQLGFNFLGKINFASLLHKLSWRSRGDLWITEFNWPLENTVPFAPCRDGLVDEQAQANFLTRSYLIAMASGRVRTCYWHQLVAPGYGLVDNRSGKAVRKYPSYFAFANLIKLFSDAKDVQYSPNNLGTGMSSFQCRSRFKGESVKITAFWVNENGFVENLEKADIWIDQAGNVIEKPAEITQSVVYAIKNY